MSNQSFKKGEVVIVHDGTKKVSSVELRVVGDDSSYAKDDVLIQYGAFNIPWLKKYVHKLPPTLKRFIKEKEEFTDADQ